MNTTNKEIKEKEERLLLFRQEVEGLRDISDAEEYAKQLAHLFLSNGLSLKTILLMAIDFGQQHPHWISVEEELPKERGQYFVYTAADQSWQSEWMQDKSGEWHWFCSPMTVGTIANVTHWMPIVPPRKEG
jgi:hypothetical protein